MRRAATAAAAAVLLAACGSGAPGGPAGDAARPPARKKQRQPGVNEWFTPVTGRGPVDLAGTPAAGVAFTEYRRGRFRVWHGRAIPGARADAVWRAVSERARRADLVALLDRDEVFHEGYFAQFVSDAGVVAREGTLSLAQAMVVREKHLGERAAHMRQALASATPSAEYRRETASGDQLGSELEADPEGRPYDVALTVLRGPIEDVTPFLVTGAELEPRPAELAAALRHWHKAFGALPRHWDGHSLELEVARPPRALAALRELAWQFYLMCPSPPGGTFRDNERADELLVRLERRRWICFW